MLEDIHLVCLVDGNYSELEKMLKNGDIQGELLRIEYFSSSVPKKQSFCPDKTYLEVRKMVI